MKIIDLNEKRKELTFAQLEDMLEALKYYDINISLTIKDLKIFTDELFNLYLKKGLIYEFSKDILTYFNEVICLALQENEKDFSLNYLTKGLIFCQSIMTPIDISKKDIQKTLSKVNLKIKVRRLINGK